MPLEINGLLKSKANCTLHCLGYSLTCSVLTCNLGQDTALGSRSLKYSASDHVLMNKTVIQNCNCILVDKHGPLTLVSSLKFWAFTSDLST